MLCNGLNYQTRQLLDVAAGGSLSNKYPEDAEKLIEDMANNECHWSTRQNAPRAAGIYEMNDNTALVAKVEALTQRFDQFMLGSRLNYKAIMSCDTCGARHATTECPIFVSPSTVVETVDYVVADQEGQDTLMVTPISQSEGTTQTFFGIKANSRTVAQKH